MQHSKDVYLIFSANRSGEYFGYARMRGRIDEKSAAPSPMDVTKESKSFELILPEVTFTPTTSSAPQGSIIHDHHRDTIFWEAVNIGQQKNPTSNFGNEDSAATYCTELGPHSGSSLSKPFEIEWISTNRLPFYLTRGLTNPWNANRDVKWARDGTEVETNAGVRLLGLFQQITPATT